MPNSLNSNALNQYASRFTATVLNEVYRNQAVVKGSELLKLTPVRQVNLGILNRLFDQWKNNAQAFRSIYFDFENDEVKAALQAFMNTVSQNIAVKRADLEPLLLDSVKDTVTLLFTPEVYFEEKLRAMPESVFTPEKAEQLSKYTQIHNGIAKSLAQRLSESGSDSVYMTQVIGWLYEVKSNAEILDDVTPYVSQFSEILNLDASELLPVSNPVYPPAPTVGRQEPKSFFDSALSEIETIKPTIPSAPPVPQRVEPGVEILSNIVSQTHSTERESLNNRFKVDVPKVSDENRYGNVQVKVESIAGSIPLGQRFMFVNQLFSKNSEHFDKAIYELDLVKSYEEAENLIWHRYASKYAWDVNGEAVLALLAIVKRKFNS
ncbi:hypothetical protein [Dyadobacter frigoris]|uniref:Uncharacterized protein n=1 Tax=Dyadobacter frigoris TaxID=2576211 RepID=A0A4U6CY03_9BACT|nr:hypothetical protein [Dyadobacter frigoris]TKT89602.1 hypothetical protein FDK13_22345 [Dyadobacter frigoris]GLU54182.1 hypothetical protein Dfri01_36430 [Dyadobacter frigoris]